MRRKVIAITMGCVGALVFAAQPASAIGVIPAVPYGVSNAPIVQEIGGKKHQGHHNQQRHHHHHHYYGDRSYYWPHYGYGYWPGYAYPYPYWGPPGVSLGFSF